MLIRVRMRQVIEVIFLRGDGTEGNPSREVRAYFDPERDDCCLAEHDPTIPTPWFAPVTGVTYEK